MLLVYRSVRESSSDEWLEELENPSEDESPKLSLESLSCSLELELHASAIISLNFVYGNERPINVTLKPFDWMSVPPLYFCARNFVPKIASSAPVLGYKHSGGDEAPTHWLLATI